MFKFLSIFQIQNLWYSFTRDNSFLQTPSQSLPGNQKNPSPSTFRRINNITALMFIFSSNLNCCLANNECNNEWMKVQVKRPFKSYFIFHRKSNKIAEMFCINFLQPPLPVCRGAYIPYFKINAPIFCCLLFFQPQVNPQVRISKMVNKYTIDYEPSPSQLTSRIHPLIFLWSPKGFISP